ncbi:transmembrane protein [Caballeronia catudaia]|uniref:Transmembrane protein n=1 Tax=Caballeronia catudaia TaxID=1777136 RepID=A0A158D8G0_9BURK|nr:FimV/HubP family polar landmark protein [Caballeronia catudaia]SAK90773.1 transmembrane protein [Caballeronia catudaia]
MIQRPRRSLFSSSRAAFVATGFAVCVAFWANPGDALAQASDATALAPTGQTYSVKPGQSLSDIAGELTGSNDRDVRARAARALFDANPKAFGNHDINKLKLGAVLNVPAKLGGAPAPSTPAAQPGASAPTEAPTPTEAPAAAAPASESAVAETSAASAVEPQASAPANVASAPEQQPVAEPTVQAPASAPAPAAAGGSGVVPATIGLAPVVIAIVVALIGVLLLRKRRNKRHAAKSEDVDRTPRTFASLEEAQADADRRNDAMRKARAAAAAGGAAALEGRAVARDQSESNSAAASTQSADSTRAPVTSPENEPPAATEAKPAEPFAPAAPAARHAAFVPPLHEAPVGEAEAHEPHAREIAAREAARREAEKWENEEREAAARQAAAREAEEHEIRAREAAAREALERDLAAREAGQREAEMRQVTEREELAREAAAREIIAREAELRELQTRAAEEQAAEQRAAEQRDIEEQAAREAEKSGVAPDEEPVAPHRFPMPKFPQDAIQALGSLEMELPPRMELTIKPPAVTEPATPPQETRPAALQPPPAASQPIGHVPFVPHVPQPFVRPEDAMNSQSQTQSVAAQIEAGTAGAASVAGLGATRFGPLSLDFDLGRASSATEPLPALTPAQLATIARNKLELAAEYIELGDLSGARTLLQEVIESNDRATRQQAATLLSTLAPHS